MIRGGSWSTLPVFIRSAAQSGSDRGDKDTDYSSLTEFRVARDLRYRSAQCVQRVHIKDHLHRIIVLPRGKCERRQCENCVAGTDRDLVIAGVAGARAVDELGLQYLAAFRDLDADRH